MRLMTVEEAKKIEFDILCDIHEFCRKNHLKYYLWGGTLLGAVRHQGFIPWDDDIDIIMPREDYDFFIRNYDTDRFGVQSCELNKEYPYWFAKAYDKKTKKVEPIYVPKQFDIGVDVDIFPMDKVFAINEIERTVAKRNRLRKLWYISIFKFKPHSWGIKNICKLMIYAMCLVTRLFPILNSNRIAKAVNEFGKSSSNKANCYMLYADSNIQKPLYMDIQWFSDIVELPFENRLFNIPSGYDALLTKIYGDYMTPPPPEKRITHHSNKMYWRG